LTNIAERAERLTQQRRPFVHATVVRAQEPTSAHAGDAAVILDDGSIEGFVGGQCAESSVRSAALDTLRDGRSLLLRVLPDSGAGFPETPGALVVVNPCHSGGAIEIFLRPVIPAPRLRVAGSTPIATAVAALAAFLDFEVSTDGDFAGATAAVVAGLGKGEQTAIRAALDAGVGHISLVASPKRGAQVLGEMGLTEAEQARIQSPAGLWIGARTPPEIALSIMTEVVRAIRLGGLTAAEPAPAEPRQAIDPVCGMTVLVTPDALHAVVGGEDFWFCGPGCLSHYTAA
jgi:xanthine dehydrogenase accessory factor